MSKRMPRIALAFALLAALAGTAAAQTAEEKIADALTAGPATVTEAAKVMDWDGTVLREGSNGWTCMPTPPGMAGNAPMCLDEPWVAWAQAWMGRTTPAISRVGVGYMLAGDTGASNTDPYATSPDSVTDWVDAGAHVMILVPDAAAIEAVPTDPAAGAFVMWKGTPYAHIMIPVGDTMAMHHAMMGHDCAGEACMEHEGHEGMPAERAAEHAEHAADAAAEHAEHAEDAAEAAEDAADDD